MVMCASADGVCYVFDTKVSTLSSSLSSAAATASLAGGVGGVGGVVGGSGTHDGAGNGDDDDDDDDAAEPMTLISPCLLYTSPSPRDRG